MRAAASPIMPVRSGYGPAVSSALTAQLAAPDIPVVVVVVLLVAAVELALVGEEAHPATKAAPARLSASITSRRLSLRLIGDIIADGA